MSSEYTWGEPIPYAPFPEEGEDPWGGVMGPDTAHLPDEVVATEFAMVVLSRTTNENPRMGALQISLQWGDRENPHDLNPQEAQYLREILLTAVRMVSSE